MKKFECKYCKKNCILTVEEHDMQLRLCPYSSLPLYAGWHEVVDSAENEQTTIEQPSNARQLPDWAKVGEWVYCPTTGNYGEVVDQQGNTVLLRPFGSDDDTVLSKDINIILERGKPAKKRPFNADEMKALVGKAIEGTSINFRALIHYYTSADDSVFTIYNSYNAKELMENHITIDGKPCYVLEHLENGEWVE